MNGPKKTRITPGDHGKGYPPGYLAALLKEVGTVAMVGASPDPAKPSHEVLKFMRDAGYEMIPVNPRQAGGTICGLAVYATLADIDRPVDMVQVFRRSEALPDIARQAIAIAARVLWTQLGVRHDDAARLAEAAGITVVMDRCPKIELSRPPASPSEPAD